MTIMKRTVTMLCFLALGLSWGCSTERTANENSTATRPAVVETNANVNQNLNANSAPSNVGVVTNNNGNKNTAGIRSINDNANTRHKSANGNN